MNKLIATSALALLIGSPAFAQDTAPLNTENADREEAQDLIDEDADDEYFYFRDADNRRLRVRRDRFMMNADNDMIELNTENADREAAK